MSRFSLRTMAEIGVMVAVALVLNFFRLFQMPQGGSVSLEMLPIFIVALRWGTLPGIIAGALFGVAQLFFGASIYYPLQVILDYPLAFALLGLAGAFPRRPLLGITIGTVGRFLAHVISGVAFFAEYAPEGTNVWVYSLGYNLTYIVPELLLCGIAVYFLAKRPGFYARVTGRQYE
ncbi:MAG TPA: energy-coupled thiamine transporter ThiT [Firmicutes bacterium]|nr:energy-coupled thiamine transporter ThiT [Bacillota bacterium]